MRIYLAGLVTIFLLSVFLINSCKPTIADTNYDQRIKNYYSNHTDTLISFLTQLEQKIKQKKPVEELKESFFTSRLRYKKIEAITEYYFQGLTKRINGPALPDVKPEDGVVWPAHGFQVIEQILFDEYRDSAASRVITEINLLKTDLKFTVSNLELNSIASYHVEEMIQHGLIRITTIGITGFDAPLSQYSLPETRSSLQGINDLMKIYRPEIPIRSYDASILYISQHDDFNSFDRLVFITDYLMPLSDEIASLNAASTDKNQPFKGGLSALMKGKSFNADFFSNYAIAASNPSKVDLGKLLFYDKALSSSKSISCGSCHKPELSFADGQIKAVNFVHGGSLSRNTPTVLYAGFQNNQFYDLRSASLEDQVNEVMNNKKEFNLSHENVQPILQNNEKYKVLFAAAFGVKDSISSFYIRNAIAAYVRSLSNFSSPFDEYMNGNKNALSPEQIKGFNLFTGKAKCATCHFIPLFNGTIPPWYNKTESEIIGVPAKPVWHNASIDADSGRYKINAFQEYLFAFKTPTLRNVGNTGPYMHNGVYKTLDEVVEFYHRGGGVGLGIDLPFQTLPFDSLQLSNGDKKAIVRFMQGLNDGLR